MTKTLLVTGAAGFTGRYVLSLAREAGFKTVALTQNACSAVPNAEQVIQCDLTSMEDVKSAIKQAQPDYVLHLAAVSFVAHGSTKDMYLTNVVGTLNLLDALAEQPTVPEKVVVASSGNVYGSCLSLPITENEPVQPANDYGASKVAMETAVRLRMGQLPMIMTRPFNYTGVGQAEHFLVPKIVKAFKRRDRTIELGNLDVSRDFSDVRDVAEAYIRLLRAPAHSAVFNICSGKSTSLLSIIEKLNALAGYKIDVTVNPDFVRASEIKELYGSDDKLRKVIGDYRSHALDDTLQWMLNDG